MSERTTIVLGAAERRAAKRLSVHWGVTPSEAIRRALMKVATEELVQSRQLKARQREALLERMVEAAKGIDVDAEIARINEERDAW